MERDLPSLSSHIYAAVEGASDEHVHADGSYGLRRLTAQPREPVLHYLLALLLSLIHGLQHGVLVKWNAMPSDTTITSTPLSRAPPSPAHPALRPTRYRALIQHHSRIAHFYGMQCTHIQYSPTSTRAPFPTIFTQHIPLRNPASYHHLQLPPITTSHHDALPSRRKETSSDGMLPAHRRRANRWLLLHATS